MLRINSIQIKILSIIILILLLTIVIVLYITARNQQNNLLKASEKNLSNNTRILNNVIRNIMLSGDAPIAVNTMQSLKEMQTFTEIAIYRTDGTNAFNDYSTIEMVNENQDSIIFRKTDRINRIMINNPDFINVLDTNTPKQVTLREDAEMEYFFPILNLPECHQCHSADHAIRGIAHFKISVADIYRQINEATKNLTFLFLLTGTVLGFLLIIFIHRIIIRPLLKIGSVVKRVGEGQLDVEVDIKSKDELGDLATKINSMTKGLKERFQLSKYVSRSTDELVRQGSQESSGLRKNITVLFSDIRGFTRYSDKNDPQLVINQLNHILQIQANIIEQFNGDIDKFVGDEIMAVFQEPQQAVRCAFKMVREVYRANQENKTNLYIGIGINSGEVVAGNIGSLNRREYAIIGDVVNLGARLCSIAKPNMIIVSRETYLMIEDIVEAKLVEKQHIKGKHDLIDFYIISKIK